MVENPGLLLNLTKSTINIISQRLANDSYDLENEMAEFYFAGMLGTATGNEDDFHKKMWAKYGKPMPDF
jgi:hypothetical protein